MKRGSGDHLKLPTRTKPLVISVSKKKEDRQEKITHQHMFRLQSQMGIGSKQILAVGQTLRKAKCQIEPKFREALFERNRKLQPFFYEKKIDIQDSKGNVTPTSGVFCKNIPKLTNFIKSERGLANSSLIRISLDGGQQSFKVSVSIFDPNQKSHESCQFLDSGVKKIIILAIVPNCPESYINLKIILDEINLSALEVTHPELRILFFCAPFHTIYRVYRRTNLRAILSSKRSKGC